jgi:hypothetical protein
VISPSFPKYEDNYRYINLSLTLMHSLCLMLLSISMLFYGVKLQFKLANSTVKSAPGKATKLSIILRINGMLTVCNVCFFLRVVVLGILCSDIITNSTYADKRITDVGWYVMSNWIPTLIPVSDVSSIPPFYLNPDFLAPVVGYHPVGDAASEGSTIVVETYSHHREGSLE